MHYPTQWTPHELQEQVINWTDMVVCQLGVYALDQVGEVKIMTLGARPQPNLPTPPLHLFT